MLPVEAVANQFTAFEDRPRKPDAWDIDLFYDDKCWFSEPATSITIVENGPLRVTLEIKRQILHSEYTQRISLVHNSPQIYFDTTINWNEKCIFLKVISVVSVSHPVWGLRSV